VSVVIYLCDEFDFKNFGYGVFKRSKTECAHTEFSHAVTVTGYGVTDRDEKYWEIRNSYSSQWGNNGYMRLARDVEWEGGQNGILERPMFPMVCSDPQNTGTCTMTTEAAQVYKESYYCPSGNSNPYC